MPIWRSARNLMAPTSSGALAFWAVGLLAATINIWDVAEQWRDRIQGSRMSTDHFDFIIVGAGTAGSVVASRLSSEKYSVLLLEAGGKPFPGTQIPAATLHIQRHKAHDWNFRARRSGEACLACEHREQVVSAGKMLGGSSALGFNIWSRGHFKDYDAWSNLTGDSRWSYKELSGFFEKAERQFESGASEISSSSNFRNRLRSLQSTPSEGGGIQVPENGLHKRPAEIFLEAASSNTKLDYKSVDFEQGFGMAYYPMANGRRFSAYDAYVKPIRRMRSDKLTVVKYAEVSKILFEPGSSKKVIGVEFVRHGRSHQMFAMKEVILSAGALQSPKLLMLSGIGPRRHLEDLKIPVLLDSPGVGANLQDFESTYIGPFISKSSTRNSVLIDRDIKPKDFLNWASRGVGTLTSPGIPAFGYSKSNDSRPEIQYLLNSCAVHSEWSKTFSNAYGIQKSVLDSYISEALRQDSFFVLTSVLRPRRRGQIRLRTSSSAGPLDIQLHSLEDVEDLKVAVQGTKAIVKLIETSPTYQRLQTCLTRKKLPGCTKFPPGSDQYWECYWRHLTISRHNYVGTCSMGPSDTAVVDSELRVKGIKNLRIIDASVAPSLPIGGTYAMTVMIGERGAKFVMDAWRQGRHLSDETDFNKVPVVTTTPKSKEPSKRHSGEQMDTYTTTTESWNTSSSEPTSTTLKTPSVEDVQTETSSPENLVFDFTTTTTAPEVTTIIPVEKPTNVTKTPVSTTTTTTPKPKENLNPPTTAESWSTPSSKPTSTTPTTPSVEDVQTETSSPEKPVFDITTTTAAPEVTTIIPVVEPHEVTKKTPVTTTPNPIMGHAPSGPTTASSSPSGPTRGPKVLNTTTTPAAVDYDDNGSDVVDTGSKKPSANGHDPSIIDFDKKPDKNVPDEEKTTDYIEWYPPTPPKGGSDTDESANESRTSIEKIDDVKIQDSRPETTTTTPNPETTKATGNSDEDEVTGTSENGVIDSVSVPIVEVNTSETVPEVRGGGATTLAPRVEDNGTAERTPIGPSNSGSDRNDTGRKVENDTEDSGSTTSVPVEDAQKNVTKEVAQEAPVELETTSTSPEVPRGADAAQDLGISESGPGVIGGLTPNTGSSDVVKETTTNPIRFEIEIKEDLPVTVPSVTPAASLERGAGIEQKTNSSLPDFNVTCTSNTVELRGTTLPSKFNEPSNTTPKQEPSTDGASDYVDLTRSSVENTGLFDGTTTSKTVGEITTTPMPKTNHVNPEDLYATTAAAPRIHFSPVHRAPEYVPIFKPIQTTQEEPIETTPDFGEDTTTEQSSNGGSQMPETAKPEPSMISNRSNAGRSFETSDAVASEEPQAQSITPVPGHASDSEGEAETTEAISREAVQSQTQLNESVQETTELPEVPKDDFKSSADVEATTAPSMAGSGRDGDGQSMLNFSTTFGPNSSLHNESTATVPTSALEDTTDVPAMTELVAAAGKAKETTTKSTDFGDSDLKPAIPIADEDDSSRSSEECGSCLTRSSENKDTSEEKNVFTATTKPIVEVHETTTATEIVVEFGTTPIKPSEDESQTSTPKPVGSNSRGPKFINVSNVQGLNQVTIMTTSPTPDGASRRLPPIMPDQVHDLILRINQAKTTSEPETLRETSTMIPELDFDEVALLVTEDSVQATTPEVNVDLEVHPTIDVGGVIEETTLASKLPESSVVSEVQNKTGMREQEEKLEEGKFTASTEEFTQVTTTLPSSSFDGVSVNRLPQIHPGDIHNFLRSLQNKSTFTTESHAILTTSQKPSLPEGDVHQRYLVPQSNNLAINFSAYYGEQGEKLGAEVSSQPSSKSGASTKLCGSLLLVFFGIIMAAH